MGSQNVKKAALLTEMKSYASSYPMTSCSSDFTSSADWMHRAIGFDRLDAETRRRGTNVTTPDVINGWGSAERELAVPRCVRCGRRLGR
ncbi:hypothetical protein AVEN_198011-1 [Araneus ventricosus]|uniref:Uncharacterized protein n=1 Tax=Araneus ventricosus TaxID=182803 RepID=A0A4Y2QQC0_ARAVE|nr:hypothetical protein AVEN_198011-1 [Araneus ventricosus]